MKVKKEFVSKSSKAQAQDEELGPSSP